MVPAHSFCFSSSTRDDVTALIQEHRQHPEWLLLEPEFDPFLAEFSPPEIDLEHAKPHDLRGVD